MKRSDTAPFRTTGTGGRYYLDGGQWWIAKVRAGKWRLVERVEGEWITRSEEKSLTDAIRYYKAWVAA